LSLSCAPAARSPWGLEIGGALAIASSLALNAADPHLGGTDWWLGLGATLASGGDRRRSWNPSHCKEGRSMTADISALLINLATAFPFATKLVTVLSAIAGLMIVGRGIGDFYAMAIAPGRRETTPLGALGKLLIGGAMVSMPFLLWKSGNTFVLGGTGETTIFSYRPPGQGGGVSAYCQGINSVVVLYFFMIGVTAIYRGFILLYQMAGGFKRHVTGEAVTFLIAGTVCFFIVDAGNLVGNTLGLKIGFENICQLLDGPTSQ
jgi:hypothetical protein